MLIHVSNLDRSTSVDELWDLFAEFGDVEEVQINDDPDPDKDTFSGWVKMPYDSEAEEAIAELHGEYVDGRDILVKATDLEAIPEPPDPVSEEDVDSSDE